MDFEKRFQVYITLPIVGRTKGFYVEVLTMSWTTHYNVEPLGGNEEAHCVVNGLILIPLAFSKGSYIYMLNVLITALCNDFLDYICMRMDSNLKRFLKESALNVNYSLNGVALQYFYMF